MIYFEQTSHHPPRSHYYIEGPNGNYLEHGHLTFTIRSNPYSASVDLIGNRTFIFKDGMKIEYGWLTDYLFNIFVGTISH